MNNTLYTIIKIEVEEAPSYSDEEWLWFRVFKQAVEDLDLPTNNRYCSFAWFLSSREDIGSFLWICFHLDFCPEFWVRKLAKKLHYHFIAIK